MMRTGDIVRHYPSGEAWVVARVKDGRVYDMNIGRAGADGSGGRWTHDQTGKESERALHRGHRE